MKIAVKTVALSMIDHDRESSGQALYCDGEVDLRSLTDIKFDDSCIDSPALVRRLYETYGISVPLVSGSRKIYAMPGDELYVFVTSDMRQINSPDELIPEDVEIICKRYHIF